MTIQEFPLAWRWTQSSHAVLPPDVLAGIRPLSPTEAAQVQKSSTYQHNGPADSCSTEDEADEASVRTWSRRVQPDLLARIFISWSEDLAVETSWDIFTEYWSDFCYPSSDDVAIIPVAGSWRMFYHHFEEFEFVTWT
jgi:hypothetical protein